MTETADIVVIGAGVNGASTAFHLTRRGAGRIIILEQGTMASGATGKSGALVRCHYTNRPETELARHSLDYFHNWQELVGGDCGFVRAGILILTRPDRLSQLEHNTAMQQAVGVNTSVISHEQALEIDPELQLDDVGGIAWEPDAGYADPHATTHSFLEAAKANGAELRLGTKVTEIIVDNGRVRGVRTPSGVIHTDNVVLAGGAWAKKLLDPLGVDNIGLIPTATSVTVFRNPVGMRQDQPTCIDHTHNTWMRPVAGGMTLIGTEVGAVTNIEPDGYPETPGQDYVDLCFQKLTARLPRMAHSTMRGTWTGLIMRSEDSHPVIDHLPQAQGLFLMSGDSGSSFKTAPAIGKCLGEWVLDGQATTVDLAPFNAGRFAAGKPWRDEHPYSSAAQTISR